MLLDTRGIFVIVFCQNRKEFMYKIISVDMQNDFASEGGVHYNPRRQSVQVVTNSLIPMLLERKIQIGEIISDYRQPRTGDKGDCCHPGTWGYESIIPNELVHFRHIKCMNSPFFTRHGIGDKKVEPGLPLADTEDLYHWLRICAGPPGEKKIILFGLTLDCCVLSTAQAIRWGGYEVRILMPATDTTDAIQGDKEIVMSTVLKNWAHSYVGRRIPGSDQV